MLSISASTNIGNMPKKFGIVIVSPFSMGIQNYQQTNRVVQNRNEYYTH
jgi:hypothetical protein